jgi:hypothetical protein
MDIAELSYARLISVDCICMLFACPISALLTDVKLPITPWKYSWVLIAPPPTPGLALIDLSTTSVSCGEQTSPRYSVETLRRSSYNRLWAPFCKKPPIPGCGNTRLQNNDCLFLLVLVGTSTMLLWDGITPSIVNIIVAGRPSTYLSTLKLRLSLFMVPPPAFLHEVLLLCLPHLLNRYCRSLRSLTLYLSHRFGLYRNIPFHPI